MTEELYGRHLKKAFVEFDKQAIDTEAIKDDSQVALVFLLVT